MIDRLLSSIAPHICCNCRTIGALLCDSCINDINEEGFGQCVVCLRPSAGYGVCSACRTNTVFDDAYVAGWRRLGLRNLIDQHKFERARAASGPLCRLLDERLPILPANCVIVPIPTLRAHIRQRGYDHIGVVASELAKRRGLVVQTPLRRISSFVQHGSSLAVRNKQAKMMFSLKEAGKIDAPILLLDDIYTTGATVNAAARLLRQYSDQPIYLAIIARQPLDDSGDLW